MFFRGAEGSMEHVLDFVPNFITLELSLDGELTDCFSHPVAGARGALMQPLNFGLLFAATCSLLK